jgi:phosphatidylinositol glycan class O
MPQSGSRNFLSFLAFFFLLHLIASFFFYQGFLLIRYEVPNKSQCDDPPFQFTVEANHSGCWYPATFKKAVIILVDALRFDFVPLFNASELEAGMYLLQPV